MYTSASVCTRLFLSVWSVLVRADREKCSFYENALPLQNAALCISIRINTAKPRSHTRRRESFEKCLPQNIQQVDLKRPTICYVLTWAVSSSQQHRAVLRFCSNYFRAQSQYVAAVWKRQTIVCWRVSCRFFEIIVK